MRNSIAHLRYGLQLNYHSRLTKEGYGIAGLFDVDGEIRRRIIDHMRDYERNISREERAARIMAMGNNRVDRWTQNKEIALRIRNELENAINELCDELQSTIRHLSRIK